MSTYRFICDLVSVLYRSYVGKCKMVNEGGGGGTLVANFFGSTFPPSCKNVDHCSNMAAQKN